MTKLRDRDRLMCELLDIAMGTALDRNGKLKEVTKQLEALLENFDLYEIKYTKPSIEELTYSLEIAGSLFCGKADNLEEFTQLFGWDLSDYEHYKDQGNSLKGFAISFLRFG